MIQIPFWSVAERQPQHQDAIIWLWRRSAFDMVSFEPREITVEYTWANHNTGDQINFDPDDPDIPEGFTLEILFGHHFAEPRDLWCPLDTYVAIFDEYEAT